MKLDPETQVISRSFSLSPEDVFDAWLDPSIRRTILLRSTYKNCLKGIDPVEGGIEFYEQRWKNKLYGHTTRTYLSISRPLQIVAEVRKTANRKQIPKYFPAPDVTVHETLLFTEAGTGTELMVFEELVSIKPRVLGPFQSKDNSPWWKLDLDVFEKALLERQK